MFYRQGDVGLRLVREIPQNLERVGDGVVARGEVTGHAHKLTGDALLFRDPASQQLWVQVMSSATITHDEHGPITLERGLYEVIGQREYSPEAIRRVMD